MQQIILRDVHSSEYAKPHFLMGRKADMAVEIVEHCWIEGLTLGSMVSVFGHLAVDVSTPQGSTRKLLTQVKVRFQFGYCKKSGTACGGAVMPAEVSGTSVCLLAYQIGEHCCGPYCRKGEAVCFSFLLQEIIKEQHKRIHSQVQSIGGPRLISVSA